MIGWFFIDGPMAALGSWHEFTLNKISLSFLYRYTIFIFRFLMSLNRLKYSNSLVGLSRIIQQTNVQCSIAERSRSMGRYGDFLKTLSAFGNNR